VAREDAFWSTVVSQVPNENVGASIVFASSDDACSTLYVPRYARYGFGTLVVQRPSGLFALVAEVNHLLPTLQVPDDGGTGRRGSSEDVGDTRIPC